MKLRRGGDSGVVRAFYRFFFGDRPYEDEEFLSATNAALARAREYEQRIALLSDRVSLLEKKR